MPFTAEKDAEFGDAHFDVSKSEKRLVRATIKSYEKTGSYVFLKLFKKTDYDYEFQQKRTLTLEYFEKLIKKSPKIRSTANNSNDTGITAKATPAKKQRLKQKDDEHEVSEKKNRFDKLVEAMYERSPGYFKQFQKNLRFFVSEEKPSSMFARNYAVCMHFENNYCEVLPSNHYHWLFYVSDVSTEKLKQNKFYAVPCSYTTFKTFFFKRSHSGDNWRDFRKTQTSCGIQWFSAADKGEATSIQKRLPNLSNALSNNHNQSGIVGYKSPDNAEKTLNQQLQTDRISTETLKRFENILYGPHSGAFCQTMDIFVSGYGKLDIDNVVLCVRLVFEDKIKF